MWTYDGSKIVSGSADKSVRAWDAETGQQSKKMSEHTSFVNSVCTVRRGPQLIVSASDDGTARLWDLRVKGSQQTITEKFQAWLFGSVTTTAAADSRRPVTAGYCRVLLGSSGPGFYGVSGQRGALLGLAQGRGGFHSVGAP